MKKIILTISFLLSIAFAQKKDTVMVVATFTVAEYQALMKAIDANIDSKKAAKEVLEFIDSRAKIVADKPKPVK